MKRNMNVSALTMALALAGVVLFGGHARADTLDTITATITFPVSGRTYNVDTSLGPNTYAGLASGTESDPDWNFLPAPDGKFAAWCLEPQEFLVGTNNYNINTLEQAPVKGSGAQMGTRDSVVAPDGPGGKTRADDMRLLFGGAYDFATNTFYDLDASIVGGLSGQGLRTAFQLAVWEIANETAAVYEVRDTGDSATRGIFYRQSGGFGGTDTWTEVATQANYWLGRLSMYSPESGLLALVDPTNGQDFIVKVVPIPAAAWLFGSALFGVAALGRRCRKTETV